MPEHVPGARHRIARATSEHLDYTRCEPVKGLKICLLAPTMPIE